MNVTRNGKIARLPKTVRDELNRRLSDGEPGNQLVVWLNAVPEVQTMIAAEFGGRAVREQNLSEWKQGGYQDWLRQQEALELVRSLSAEGEELQAVTAAQPFTERLVIWLAARYAVATRQLEGQDGKTELDWQKLRELCSDVVALRRGDHSAARLKIEQERLERDRQKTEEDLVEHFQRWAKNPRVRDWICRDCISEEERERRMREIFGLSPDETPAPADRPTAQT
jgi:hypothetical protein